jgi:hypothetical protein
MSESKKITIAVTPTRSLLEKLSHHWGYTLEETSEVYAVLVQHSAVPPSKPLSPPTREEGVRGND